MLAAVWMLAACGADRDAASGGGGGAASGEVQRPNLLILMADDLGVGDVSVFGGAPATPQIDALAEQGMRLDRFYAEPLCSQTRAALLTGRHPASVGIGPGVVRPWARDGLATDATTLAEWLQASGYRTALIGKWHLGHARRALWPTARGFDHFYGHLLGAVDYYTHERNGGLDWQRNGESVREAGYSTRLLADEAVRWLGQHAAGEAFFLQVAFNAVHPPIQAPPSSSGLSDPRDIRAAMIVSLDAAIGRVLAALDANGLAERTLVLFLSDNGARDDKGSGAARRGAAEARGAKGGAFEGGIRVPALARWPGVVPAGAREGRPVAALDVFPTVAAAFGLAPPEGVGFDGVDRWRVLRGEPAPPRPPLFFASDSRTGRYRAVLDGRWKLIDFREGGRGARMQRALFDVVSDPAETTDLAGPESERAARLAGLLRDWVSRHFPGDSLGVTNPGRDVAPDDWRAPTDWAEAAGP